MGGIGRVDRGEPEERFTIRVGRTNTARACTKPKGSTNVFDHMAFIEGLRETLGADTADAGPDDEEYRCIDCYAEFDERKRLCPKCGGEEFERV